MALSDVEQIRTTDLNTETTFYAGNEPWNKNLQGYEIDGVETDVSIYQPNFSQWHGIYRNIGEFRSTIDIWSRWIVGKKLKISDKDKQTIDRITGNGKDTFRQILLNQKRVSKFNGDSFAEIIRDKARRLINLKPLDPGTIRIVGNEKGIIIKYEQVRWKGRELKGKQQEILNSWNPDEIFHIPNDKIADEIHGIPEAEKLLRIIKIYNQGIDDYTTILHRYGKPTYFFEANTDDDTELASITNKINKSIKNFENVITPKGTLEDVQNIKTANFGTIDPIPWFKFLRSFYTESSNVPDLIRGKSEEVSLAAGKLNYLGFKERLIMEQIEFSEQIKNQLGLDIEFEEPADIDIEVAMNRDGSSGNPVNRDKEEVKQGP